MSSDHAKSDGKDDSAGRKTSSARPQEPALKCPRCDSPNTKFCYYNNYSLTQPRHFCKTCRRYWTKGGALRNVPIGGGCRKNKKLKSSPRLPGAAGEPSKKDVIGSADVGGLKFFQGISPAMDFQIGFPSRLHHGNGPGTGMFTQFSYSGNSSNTCDAISSNPNFSLLDPNNSGGEASPPLMGFSNFPFLSGLNQEIGSLNVHSNLASSIESLSSINQDLHWKLQQQRLGMIPSMGPLVSTSKPQPITFDISKQESCPVETPRKDHGLSTEWFFDNPFATMSQTAANQYSNGNWNGIEAWSGDIRQFTAPLP